MMVMIITSQRTKERRGDHTNNYDYGGGGDGGDNDKSVDVPWSILSPFPKPQCLRKFFLQFFKLEISFWDRCIRFFCSNSTLNWKKLYVWPQKNLLCNFSRKIVLGKEKPTIGWRLHRSFITLRDFPKLSYVIMILMELMMMTMMMTIVMENDTMIYSMIWYIPFYEEALASGRTWIFSFSKPDKKICLFSEPDERKFAPFPFLNLAFPCTAGVDVNM